jgi:tetratricopeptide (TPR) repeat protein
MAVTFSAQLHACGDVEIASELVDQVVTKIQIEETPEVALLAAEVLRNIEITDASNLIDRIFEVERLRASPKLWRYAAEVADSAGHKRAALDYLEQAVLLEYESRPETINLQIIRTSYSTLLNNFGEVIDASATLELPPPKELRARIIRAADQWRSIDDNDTQCCQITARLLTKLNSRDLAWAYLTTPLAKLSGESASWHLLADELMVAKEYDLADIAWERAFEMESTNPELLVERAELAAATGTH